MLIYDKCLSWIYIYIYIYTHIYYIYTYILYIYSHSEGQHAGFGQPVAELYKSPPSYGNIAKICMLYLHENVEILTYPNQYELLNKISELVSKCYVHKYLLSNYKAND